jgi:hypothetical protein
VNFLKDIVQRLRPSRIWIAAQFIGMPLLILIGLAWTRLPEKHAWQVALSLVLPLLLAAALLALQAVTMRSFVDDAKRVKLHWGALTLLAWIAVVWLAWALLDSYDERISNWASYWNSQAPAFLRARLLTYEHIATMFTVVEWLLRWIVVPAAVIPHAVASAQWGWRLPWRRIMRLLRNWRWALAVALTAAISVWLPSFFFDGAPHGSVSAQVARVTLKLVTTYLLAIFSWIFLLVWAAVLFKRIPETVRSREVESFCRNLHAGWRWIAAEVGVILVVNLPLWPLTETGTDGIAAIIAIGIRMTAFVAIFVLLIILFRSFLANAAKKTKIHWGILASIVWFGITFAVASMDDKFPLPLLHWKWGEFVTFVLFAPFVACAAVWGWVLPWKRIAALFINPRWLVTGVATFVGEAYLASAITKQLVRSSQPDGSTPAMYNFLAMTLSLGFIVLQLAWLAALLDESPLPIEASSAEAKAPVAKAGESDAPGEALP